MDYVGVTNSSLHDRLISECPIEVFSDVRTFMDDLEHREHGNRIMHEFLLGQQNILRDLPRPKVNE